MIKDLLQTNYFKSNGEKLLVSGLLSLNTNKHGQIDKEVGCAISVTNILKDIMDFTGSGSTTQLYNIFINDTRFEKITTDIKAGDIILSPTGLNKLFDNPNMTNGHVGIVGLNNTIMSNNSNTGLFDIHYTLDSWIKRYRVDGGYRIYFFRLKDN